ncbi:MAG: leucine-rich repeat protein [Aeriscardovia sp.]|nr:leucine-rich repeat protein [Aeriscardovia sp.]
MNKNILLLYFLLSIASISSAQDMIETNSNLTTGYVKATIPYRICTIDGVLFACYSNGDPYVLIRYPIGDSRQQYTIPNTVNRIARGAFQGCKNLQILIIPQTVYYIGDNAFEDSSISSFKVEGADETSAHAPAKTSTREIARYNLAGRQITSPTPGVNIVHMSDNSYSKVYIKKR